MINIYQWNTSLLHKYNLVLTSGGMDPLTCAHVRLIRASSLLSFCMGPGLVFGLNSDEWLTRKKGKPFMKFDERKEILESIKGVNAVINFDDSDNSAANFIERTVEIFGTYKHMAFTKGGDRSSVDKLPSQEVAACEKYGIDLIFGVGGSDKVQSSSWLLEEWVKYVNSRKI